MEIVVELKETVKFGYKVLTSSENKKIVGECLNFPYYLNVQASVKGPVKLCENALHFCENPLITGFYYMWADSNGETTPNDYVFTRVKAEGKILGEDGKFGAEKLTIVEVYSFNDWLEICANAKPVDTTPGYIIVTRHFLNMKRFDLADKYLKKCSDKTREMELSRILYTHPDETVNMLRKHLDKTKIFKITEDNKMDWSPTAQEYIRCRYKDGVEKTCSCTRNRLTDTETDVEFLSHTKGVFDWYPEGFDKLCARFPLEVLIDLYDTKSDEQVSIRAVEMCDPTRKDLENFDRLVPTDGYLSKRSCPLFFGLCAFPLNAVLSEKILRLYKPCDVWNVFQQDEFYMYKTICLDSNRKCDSLKKNGESLLPLVYNVFPVLQYFAVKDMSYGQFKEKLESLKGTAEC